MSDTTQLLREAVRATLLANAALATVSGGTPRVVDRQAYMARPTLPLIAYEVVEYDYGADRALLRLTGAAASTSADAEATANEMATAAVEALTADAFTAQGLDAFVEQWGAESIDDAGRLDELFDFADTQNPKQADRRVAIKLFT